MKTERLLARITDDNYLLAATSDFEHGYDDKYWPDYYDGDLSEKTDTVLVEVPDNMIDHVLNHGTSDQWYSDGYEAWNEILKKGKVFE